MASRKKRVRETSGGQDNPGAVFREAREREKKSQTWVADSLHVNVSAISDLENGRFTTPKGKLKRDVPWLVREVAKLYNRPELEEYYCSNICPIGKQRQQLQYHDIDAIRERLCDSLEQLGRNTRSIVETLQDGEITKDEWDRCEEMLKILQEVSHATKSAELWARVRGGRSIPPRKRKSVPARAEENPYKRVRLELGMDQNSAGRATDIDHGRMSGIEQSGSKRELPNVHEAISLSRAYLSPRIRNFYCYHDCLIGGTQEALDIHSLPRVALMLVSSLYYVKDMNTQLSFAMAFAGEAPPDPNMVQDALPELKELSKRADTLSLWMQEELCARLRVILADNRVTEEEREDFVRILGFLKQLNLSEDFIEEMRSYLNEEK